MTLNKRVLALFLSAAWPTLAAQAQPPPADEPLDEADAGETEADEPGTTGIDADADTDAAAAPDALGAGDSARGAEVDAELGTDDLEETDASGDLPPILDEPDVAAFDTRLYGFIDGQWRWQGSNWPDPALRPPAHQPGWDVTPTVMIQGSVLDRFRYFINLAAPFAGSPASDLSVQLRNAFVEAAVVGDYLNVRVGKMYRRFGLYNEILDATPTFLGNEPPAYLNPGQYLATRTTNFMIHGSVSFEVHTVSYAVMTGNDEVGGEGLPIGGDIRYHLGDTLQIGTSAYYSGRGAHATRDVGEGPAEGGVINYMDEDRFLVFGGFAQLRWEGLLVEAAYFRGQHDARRNPMKVVAIATMTPVGMRLNAGQRDRLFNGVGMPTPGDVNIEADYTVQTAYARLGYEIALGDAGALTPYVHLDWYKHGEAIPGPPVGGNEAGLSDDAQFYRLTPGLMYRPIPAVALKAEFNTRLQTIMGTLERFHEVRTSLSYLWEL